MNRAQIENLLKSCQANSLIQNCISLLATSLPQEVTISEPTVANTKELLSIYRRRLTVHENLNLSTIEGGEKLIEALGKETDDDIAVIEMRFPSVAFMIFTDNQVKRLLGCFSIQ